jgi:hypothetical protein
VTVLKAGPDVLARAVADHLVISADPAARAAGPFYWEDGRPRILAVVQAVRDADDEEIRSLGERLLDDPADPGRHAELTSALCRRDPAEPSVAALFDLAWQAECTSRLGYHLGPRYARDVPAVTADDLRALPPGIPLPADPLCPDPTAARSGAAGKTAAGREAEVLIVVPFRDAGTGGRRLRNLLACLLALRDQSYPRAGYRVTVVETDEKPRWREVIAPYADHYLFAAKSGDFNRSWAVNVGAVHSPGHAEVICILDSDVLADREFVARNAARFRQPGTGGHLTYRNMFCLDPAASARAIRERLRDHAPQADPDTLRGFLLRRPPGCCMWTRSDAFHRIGGMDERYEGWGGEDNDFAHRLDLAVPLDTYDDWLLHLHHPPSAVLGPGGQLVNARIPSLSWRPTEPIGALDRFADRPAPPGGRAVQLHLDAR